MVIRAVVEDKIGSVVLTWVGELFGAKFGEGKAVAGVEEIFVLPSLQAVNKRAANTNIIGSWPCLSIKGILLLSNLSKI